MIAEHYSIIKVILQFSQLIFYNLQQNKYNRAGVLRAKKLYVAVDFAEEYLMTLCPKRGYSTSKSDIPKSACTEFGGITYVLRQIKLLPNWGRCLKYIGYRNTSFYLIC